MVPPLQQHATGNMVGFFFWSTFDEEGDRLVRFGINEADFGWGKPAWATFPFVKLKNTVVLIDTEDGEDGIGDTEQRRRGFI
ncbi:hypothetical protein Pint_22412 [Pistacia integerrima]|uniref:Uncharacterized protein n=1 Tax=Pistacia integerrima TaxID=434235 RepID=A0ACC0YJH8_9ROSI|nr:hypothetical protein Pint_22412 [Pistacia integerrima]